MLRVHGTHWVSDVSLSAGAECFKCITVGECDVMKSKVKFLLHCKMYFMSEMIHSVSEIHNSQVQFLFSKKADNYMRNFRSDFNRPLRSTIIVAL